MVSAPVLEQVAQTLNLKKTWGQRFGLNTLQDSEVLVLLRQRIAVSAVSNSSVGEILVYDESPSEAASLANAIAGSYCLGARASGAVLLDKAVPALRPVRPNIPLNIALGVVLGLVCGGLAGWGVLLLKRLSRKARAPRP
jgi:capsular polysaccharide biosynthesis protein